jgi:hypothetical protein
MLTPSLWTALAMPALAQDDPAGLHVQAAATAGPLLFFGKETEEAFIAFPLQPELQLVADLGYSSVYTGLSSGWAPFKQLGTSFNPQDLQQTSPTGVLKQDFLSLNMILGFRIPPGPGQVTVGADAFELRAGFHVMKVGENESGAEIYDKGWALGAVFNLTALGVRLLDW